MTALHPTSVCSRMTHLGHEATAAGLTAAVCYGSKPAKRIGFRPECPEPEVRRIRATPLRLIIAAQAGIHGGVDPGLRPLLSGILANVSLEGEAGLRVWRAQRGWFGRWLCEVAEAEGAEQADLELSEQQGGAGLETAGGGVVQDAQQHESDQRDIDLDAHGVFTAAKEAADF